MADHNIQKALRGPSAFEVALGAALGIAVGAVACILYLVFKPVEKVLALPKELAPNVVYVVTGKESSARSKGWQAKLKTIATGGEVILREEELNAWGATLSEYKPADPNAPQPPGPPKPVPKPAAKPKPGEKAKPDPLEPEDEAQQIFFDAAAPNFSIKDNRLQIAFQCKLDYYGVGKDVWVKIIVSRFTLTADGYQFTPEEFYFGSCPLHLFPGSAAYLTNRALGRYKVAEELQQAWGKISVLTFEGDQIKIVTKP